MPRRPRPSSRSAPKKALTTQKPVHSGTSKSSVSKGPSRIKFGAVETNNSVTEEILSVGDNGLESESSDEPSALEYSGKSEDEDVSSSDQDELALDVDAPRVVQWVDDGDTEPENDEQDSGDDSDLSLEAVPGMRSEPRIESLQADISQLPFGALRKAQRQIVKEEEEEEEEEEDVPSEDFSENDEATTSQNPRANSAFKPEWSTKPRTDIAKRSNKNAPIEVTSKRPVTRRRTVVETEKMDLRDPRFQPLSGELSSQKYQKQYDFLSGLRSEELKVLRENLKRARKLLINSPRNTLEEREQEVSRLELAVKRAESGVNRDRRELVESEALEKLSKEERDKRKQGKSGWWIKKADKKDLLVRARYDALAASGGQRAVKKAIEKKQKKIGQKEKKSRPFSREGEFKRPSSSELSSGKPFKRRKVV